MAEEYRVGDYVRYACSGVCRVDEIRTEAPGGRGAPRTFYILKPVDDPGSTIFVPLTSQVLLDRMQPLPTREEIDALLLSAREEELVWPEDRKARAAGFQAILKTCDLRDLLRLVSCIFRKREELTARGKRLPASDETVLRRAEGLIQNELAFVLRLSGDQVGAYIRDTLAR